MPELLEPLTSVLESVCERINHAQHRLSLESNEIRTRAALIDPVLTALGWDTSDPSVVAMEYQPTGSARRVDYALMDGCGNPTVFVEAKKLGEPLEAHREQMVTYANMQGVRFAALTDGSRWELYAVFEPKPLQERRKMEVDIQDAESVASCALQLLMLWRPNLESGKPVKANEPLIALGEHEPPVVPPGPEAGGRWLRLSEVDPGAESSKPLAMRIQEGPEVRLGTWSAILKCGADWLASNGHLSKIKVPMRMGPSRFLINSNPVHLNGKNFKSQYKIKGTDLYMELKLNKEYCVKNAKMLFDDCDVVTDSVRVLFRGVRAGVP